MKRLASVLVLMLFLLTGTVAVAIHSRRDDPYNPISRSGFGWCKSRPCWREVVPGITESSALDRFVGEPFQSFARYRFQTHVELMADTSSKHVGFVSFAWEFAYYHKKMTLGYVLNIYGPPCRVNGNRLSTEVELVYPGTRVIVVEVSDGSLSPHLPVSYIQLFDYADPLNGEGRCGKSFGVPWAGFRSHYTWY